MLELYFRRKSLTNYHVWIFSESQSPFFREPKAAEADKRNDVGF